MKSLFKMLPIMLITIMFAAVSTNAQSMQKTEKKKEMMDKDSSMQKDKMMKKNK